MEVRGKREPERWDALEDRLGSHTPPDREDILIMEPVFMFGKGNGQMGTWYQSFSSSHVAENVTRTHREGEKGCPPWLTPGRLYVCIQRY